MGHFDTMILEGEVGFPNHSMRKHELFKLVAEQMDKARAVLDLSHLTNIRRTQNEGFGSTKMLFQRARPPPCHTLGMGDEIRNKPAGDGEDGKVNRHPLPSKSKDQKSPAKCDSQECSETPQKDGDCSKEEHARLRRILDYILVEELSLHPLNAKVEDESETNLTDDTRNKCRRSNVRSKKGRKIKPWTISQSNTTIREDHVYGNQKKEIKTDKSNRSLSTAILLLFAVMIFRFINNQYNISDAMYYYLNDAIPWPWALWDRLWDATLISGFFKEMERLKIPRTF